MSSADAQPKNRCKGQLKTRGPRVAALILLVCAYWFFGFYPFVLDLPGPNSAHHSEQGALVFNRRGLAITKSAPGWLGKAVENDSLEIDLRVRSFDDSQSGPARIFTISLDYHNRNLTLAQQGSDLLVRLRRPGSTRNGEPPFVVNGVFDNDSAHRVRLRIQQKHVRLTVDGILHASETFAEDVLAGWNADYRLAIGNEVILRRPWLGEVRHATAVVDGVAIDFLGPGLVEFPPDYWWEIRERLRRAVKLPHLSNAVAADVAINLFGFIPLGGFLFWQFGDRLSMLRGILVSAAVSLSIELGQICAAGRSPSVTDFGFNVFGALVGWLLVAWVCRRWIHSSLPATIN